jgi:hypothetical protein
VVRIAIALTENELAPVRLVYASTRACLPDRQTGTPAPREDAGRFA